ncbi:glycerophosphodiester phosphodiesterase family protein [Diaminobutyricibacter sp. McL0608]|uniref:glycerophosphodiester phosphodiesterase family protein n=1 Tax=Leifsonia sp. McL0608 TaxID=3143537 RepID=UPI0031F2E5DA
MPRPASPHVTGYEGDFFATSHPRIIAHRGLALAAPENTLLAFLTALSAGATHLETDVHASADGIAVISHDPDLNRLVGREVAVGQLTMAELRRIDLGAGQSFVSLADALDAFPEARFNIDIKAEAAEAGAAAAIRAARATRRVLITSFDEGRRRRTADALPGVASSASVSRVLVSVIAGKLGISPLVRRSLAGLVATQVPERSGRFRVVTRRTVAAIHAAGREVHVWTVNDPEDMNRLLDLGVDGIVTDRCDVLKGVVDSRI